MLSIAQLSSNPGLLPVTAWDPSVSLLGYTVFLIGMIAVATAYFIDGHAGTAVGVVGALLALGGLGTAYFEEVHHNRDVRAAEATYIDSVGDWLQSDYGLEVNDTRAQLLLDGEAYTAEYGGRQTTISIVESIAGDLSVVDGTGTPLDVHGR